jgi:DNA-binding MarR family transcriptional regulator
MKSDKQEKIYQVKFSSSRADEEKIRTILELCFEAKEIIFGRTSELIRQHPQRELSPDWKPRVGSNSEKVIQLLSDNKIRRLSEIQNELGNAVLGGVVKLLSNAGVIARFGHGWYGMHNSDVKQLKPRRLTPALRRLYEMLEVPRSAVELRELLHVSRQAVDQYLKRLVEQGLVKRIESYGERGHHVYLHSNKAAHALLSKRAPSLSSASAKLLSLIPLDSPVRIRDVSGTGGGSTQRRNMLYRMRALGLVDIVGVRHRVFIQLTDRGRRHPQWDANADKAPPLSKVVNFERPTINVLLAIYALQSAKSLDLTLGLGIGRGRRGHGVGTGNYVQQLEQSGLIESVPQTSKGHPSYRLTTSGISFVAAFRGQVEFFDASVLRSRIANDASSLYRRSKRACARFFRR